MIRMLLRLLFMAVVVWGSTRSAVRAEPATSDAQQQARRYVDEGTKALQAGDYDAAIAQYQKAERLIHHPLVIFDLAQAYRMGGKLERALQLYEQYIAEAPDGEQAAMVRDLIAELKESVAASTDAGSGAKAPDSSHVSPAGEPALQPRRDHVATAAREAPPGRTLRIAGLATCGAGVAALAVGTGFALHARSLANQMRPGATWDPDKDAAGRRANKIEVAGFVAGGALIATGAALYWWGRTQEHGFRMPTVVPAASDHSVGLVLTGQWP